MTTTDPRAGIIRRSPGRPRAIIQPLTDPTPWPATTVLTMAVRMRDLADELARIAETIVDQPTPSPSAPTRVRLDEKAVLDVKETAIYLSTSEDRVYQLKREGHLKALPNLGSHYLFSREAIDAFVRSSHDEAAA